jgi:hypothetical protein
MTSILTHVAALGVTAALLLTGTRTFGAEQQAGAEECVRAYAPLREDAEKQGKLIKAASTRHASPEEQCKLLGSFGRSEIKMIKYIEANSASCEIAPHVADQLRAGHKKTEAMQQKVCALARQDEMRAPVGDFDDSWRPLSFEDALRWRARDRF